MHKEIYTRSSSALWTLPVPLVPALITNIVISLVSSSRVSAITPPITFLSTHHTRLHLHNHRHHHKPKSHNSTAPTPSPPPPTPTNRTPAIPPTILLIRMHHLRLPGPASAPPRAQAPNTSLLLRNHKLGPLPLQAIRSRKIPSQNPFRVFLNRGLIVIKAFQLDDFRGVGVDDGDISILVVYETFAFARRV